MLTGLFLLMLGPVGLQGQEVLDTLHLRIHFKRGGSFVEESYKDNRARIASFREALHMYEDRNIQTVIFTAGAAPDGSTQFNQELSEARAQSLYSFFINIGLFFDKQKPDCQFKPKGEDWPGLAAAVRSLQMPWAKEALNIIENTPLWVKDDEDHIVDSRKNRLKNLEHGAAWWYLDERIFDEYCATGDIYVIFARVAQEQAPQGRIPLTAAALPSPIVPDGNKTQDTGIEKTEGVVGSEDTKTLRAFSDTLEIKFKLDSIRVDQDFNGNRSRIRAFSNAFNRRYANRPMNTIQLDIYAGASPEGTAAHNRWLGQNRGNAIKRLIRDTLGFRVGVINVHNLAARWDDFYDSVAATQEPWRNEVLEIIRMEPSWNEQAWDHRERKLRALHGGAVWPVLLEKHLAPLRSGGSAILSYHPERDTLFVAYLPQTPQKDTLVIKDTTVIIHECMPTRPPKVKKKRGPADKTPAWAVKTNLLAWGVVAPNVAVEFPLGWRNRWSVEVEYMHPWFIWNNNANASQILNLGVEFRLWLGNRDNHRWLDGWHLGLAVAGGKYDWEWKTHEGWQGEFVNAYFNVGYQHRFGKHWAIDAGLGIGVVPSRYRHYYGGSVYPDNHLEPWDEHLIWHDTGHFFYPGASHVNVSIVYLFNNWPVRFKTMSERRRQEWHDTYYERINAEKARKQARKDEKAARKAARREKRNKR